MGQIKIDQIVNVLKIENDKSVYQHDLLKQESDENCEYVPSVLFKTLQGLVINTNNPEFCYQVAKNNFECQDTKKLGSVVISEGNAEQNYNFARDVEGADIKAHEEVVINSQDIYFNYLFAKKIEGADILAHLDAIKEGREQPNCQDLAESTGLTNEPFNKNDSSTQLLKENENEIYQEVIFKINQGNIATVQDINENEVVE